jgi:hypothetical protein
MFLRTADRSICARPFLRFLRFLRNFFGALTFAFRTNQTP